jgi:hypothetical protein
MSQTTTIILALVLSILFVFLFWYIWVKLLDWELKVWYGKIVRRREREVEQTEMDLEAGGAGGVAGKVLYGVACNWSRELCVPLPQNINTAK